MTRRRTTLLIILSLGLLGCLALFAWNIFQTRQSEVLTRELAISVTESAFGANDASALIDAAHPSLLAERPREDFAAYLASIQRRIGDLESIDSIAGGAQVPLLSLSGSAATASYEIALCFAGTPATVIVDLAPAQGAWLITAFRVDAEQLYQ